MKYLNILCILPCLLLGACGEHQQPAPARPNIILLMADDQGWGDTGYNGHPLLKTPQLDAMAANGARFERFYAASAVCSPTRASVMTGRHPLRMGICSANCGHIPQEEITLAELLGKQGYATGHFGKWHLGTLTGDTLDSNRGGRPDQHAHYAPPWEHGFEVCFSTEAKVPTYNPMLTPDKSRGGVGAQAKGTPYGTFYWTGPGKIETQNLQGDDARIIMDRALPFMQDAIQSGRPFLAVIWFHTPHLPVVAGPEHRQLYAGLSEDQQHYYGSLSALDAQVGRLRQQLRQWGVETNTMLWYTSDNGPEGIRPEGPNQGLTRGLRGRKRSLLEGGIRVPGLLEWPSQVPAGTLVQAPCFTSDYFPTIATLLGLSLQQYQRPYDGMDLLPLLTGRKQQRGQPLAFEFKEQAAFISGAYKIYSADGGRHFALYHLPNDPAEQHDLSQQHPLLLDSLQQGWHEWAASVKGSAQGQDYGHDP